MFAIAAYLAPQNTGSASWNQNATSAFNTVKPYVLTFSQWQKWDIFSPDPLRRSTSYTVDVFRNDRWNTLKTIDFAHLKGNERAKELKILGRIEDNWKDMAITYLRDECMVLPDTAGLSLRLEARSFVLPKTLAELAKFSEARPQMNETTLGMFQCPLLSAS